MAAARPMVNQFLTAFGHECSQCDGSMEGLMLMRWKQLLGLAAAAAFGLALLLPAGSARADQGFERWVASFRSTAAENGISGATFDRAFANVTDPDPEVLEKARKQAEFTAEAWDYFDNRI